LLLTVLGFAGLGSLAVYRLMHASSTVMELANGAGMAVYLAWMIWESRISVREISRPEAPHDRGTMEMCAAVKLALLLAALAGGAALLPDRVDWRVECAAAGGVLLIAGGVWLRIAAIGALGASYSHRIRTPDSPLVSSGPYAAMRHPAYVGALLVHSGVVCLLPNWFSVAALAVWFAAVAHRTRVEDDWLERTVPEYSGYRTSVPGAWIPRFFRGRPSGSLQSYLPILLSVSFVSLICGLSAIQLAALPAALAVALGVLVAVYLAWLLVESRLAIGEISMQRTGIDRGTLELYAFGRAATVLSALALPIQWTSVGAWYPIGLGIFLAGVALRLHAIRVLGTYYSHRVRISESHRIVTDGPYRALRHPAYCGMILAHCGFVVCFFNVTSTAILLLILAPAVILRIHVEERVLFELDGYREYARNRARLIPLLW
jgi:protein-S-isoprenylcysteine O-methyltransferase Ste14